MTAKLPLRVALAVAAMLIALAAAATLPAPQKKVADFELETMVPREFAGWRLDSSIVPIPPSPDVQSQLASLYEQLVARTYVNGAGERIMLTIAYGGDQRAALRSHRQEVCYRAQGFTVRDLHTSVSSMAGRDVAVTRFNARGPGRAEPVTYWMTMGDAVITHRSERLLVQIAEGIDKGEVPDGMVVRVSSLSPEPQRAYQSHVAFLDDLLRAMPARDAQRLTGGSL